MKRKSPHGAAEICLLCRCSLSGDKTCDFNCACHDGEAQGKPDSVPSTSVEPQVEPSAEDLIADAFAKAAANRHGGTIQTKIVSWTPTHENCDECNKLAPKLAADSVSHPPLEQDILDCAWRITARCGISHDCIPFIKEELDTLVRERSKRA